MNDIKVLGGGTNAIVVQLPGRRYPGVVIQGDSMTNLLNLVGDAKARMAIGDADELRDLLDEIDGILSGYVAALNSI
jgi:hypothetical protein